MTQKFIIAPGDGWVKVVDTADEQFLIENVTIGESTFRFDTTPPALGDVGHQLKVNEGVVRVATGDVYVKNNNTDRKIIVIVSGSSVVQA